MFSKEKPVTVSRIQIETEDSKNVKSRVVRKSNIMVATASSIQIIVDKKKKIVHLTEELWMRNRGEYTLPKLEEKQKTKRITSLNFKLYMGDRYLFVEEYPYYLIQVNPSVLWTAKKRFWHSGMKMDIPYTDIEYHPATPSKLL